MIYEEICTYEVCMLAKEKGFYAPTAKNYRHKNGTTCNAPSQSQLQKWLREEKNIHIEIIATASGYYWCISETNGTSITDSDVLNRGTNEGGCFDTFELCLEDALKYILQNLV